MKSTSHWIACKPIADANLPAWLEDVQRDAVANLAACLKKYQARYHVSDYARKDWDESQKAIDEVKHLL